MSWKDLNIKEKADLMKIYVSNGITKLDDIISHYNSYATGGELDNPTDEDPIYKAQPLKPVKISAKRNTIADIQRKRRLLSVEPSKEVILNTNLNKANEFYTSDVVPRLLREHEGLKTKPETSFPEMWEGHIKFDPNIREEAAAYASPFNIVSKTEPRYSRRKPLDEDFIKTMVHENTHAWQYEFPTRDREYKKTSKQLLNDAYIPTGGLKNMYGPLAPLHKHTEQEAVNREIRYKFWSELKNKLGRTPTIDELDDYINKSTDINVLLKFNNGYFKPNTPNTDDYKKTHDAVEKIKQALIHVADNNIPTEANYAALGGHLYQDGGADEPLVANTQTLSVRNPEQADWFNNWYANRSQQLANHFNTTKFNQTMVEITDNPYIKESPSEYGLSANISPQSYITEAVNAAMNVPVENKFMFNLNGLHHVDNNGENILINPVRISQSGKESTLLHERVHSINTNLPNIPIHGYGYSPIELDIYNRNKSYYDNAVDKNGEIFYYDRPNEIYSRLMQFRYDKNVDPTHKWTEDEINKLRKEGFMGIGNPLKKFNLDQYPNSFLLYLFNDVAENKTSEENVHYAANGGSLGKVTPLGQWEYPHQITTIPSNNITMKGVDYPVLGISDTGDIKYMLPNMDYLFDGNYVTEYPVYK